MSVEKSIPTGNGIEPFFLMRAIGRRRRQEKDRRHEWLTLPEAIAKASHIETRELLGKAQEAAMTQELLKKAEQRRGRT